MKWSLFRTKTLDFAFRLISIRNRCWIDYDNGVWDYCSVPTCGMDCENNDPEICGCRGRFQTDYRGTINVTRTGLPCKNWSDEVGVDRIPDSGLGVHNYCRNPDGNNGDSLETYATLFAPIVSLTIPFPLF